jgi:hypothetical protein
MASILNADDGVVSGSAGLKSTADSSGVLALQTNGTTAVTVNASQNVTLVGSLTAAGLSGPHNGTVGATTPAAGAFTTLSASGATTLSAQLTASTGDTSYPIISKDISAFSAGVSGSKIGFFGLDSTSTNTALGAISTLAQASQNATLRVQVLDSGSLATIGTFSTTGLGIGTSSPAYKLDLYNTTNFAGRWANATRGGYLYLDSGGPGIFNTAAYGGEGMYFHAGANYIQFITNSAETVRIDTSGNVGIGTTSIGSRLHVVTTAPTITTMQSTATNGGYLTFSNGSTVPLYIGFGSTLTTGLSTSDAALRYSNNLIFSSGATEAARFIAGGQLCIGKTSTAFGTTGIYFNALGQGLYTYTNNSDSGGAVIYLNRLGVDGTIQLFYKDTSAVGNIAVTTSATAYNTSSDYRLKNTIAPMTGALAKVAQLKPVTYKWNADGSDCEGFIAHELAEVVPHAVTGAKDAVDVDGKPQYQGVDTSFLVATLTAAIQELKAEFDAYKALHP